MVEVERRRWRWTSDAGGGMATVEDGISTAEDGIATVEDGMAMD
jgi:hypothetical protein